MNYGDPPNADRLLMHCEEAGNRCQKLHCSFLNRGVRSLQENHLLGKQGI